jgi:hypothetical protein
MCPSGNKAPRLVGIERGSLRVLSDDGQGRLGDGVIDLGAPDEAVRTAVAIIAQAAKVARANQVEPPKVLVLVSGDPFDGMDAHGPFAEGDDTEALTEGRLRDTPWRLVAVTMPAEEA